MTQSERITINCPRCGYHIGSMTTRSSERTPLPPLPVRVSIEEMLTWSINGAEPLWGWSARVSHCLMNENIKTVADLVRCTKEEMLRIPNFGPVSLEEVEKKLRGLDLHFGMKVGDACT
jgi:hypothetical protein